MLITHGIIYLITFTLSYYFACSDIYKFINTIILGWSIFGLTSVGHEIYHLDINKKNTKHNIILNIIGFFCLDLWSVSKKKLD